MNTAKFDREHLRSDPILSLSKPYADRDISQMHHHLRHQLIYSVTGLIMAQTESIRWAVPAGVGLIVPSGVAHESNMVGQVQLQSLYLLRSAATDAIFNAPRIVSISPLLAALIAEHCHLGNPVPRPEKLEHLDALILSELASAAPSPLALPYPTDPSLREICDQLMQQPALLPPLEQCAERARMSRRSFTRQFQAQTGLSLGQWHKRLRCQLALQSIAEGTPFKTVAYDLGYTAPSQLRKHLAELT